MKRHPEKMTQSTIPAGQVFGRLTIITGPEKRNVRRFFYQCECTCGNMTGVRGDHLLSGSIASCGCLRSETTSKRMHARYPDGKNLTRRALLGRYHGMLNRCYKQSDCSYSYYGGRGIRVCDEWRDSFDAFCAWALSHGFAPELEIDRIDGNGNYESSNCRFVTKATQQNNLRNNIKLLAFGEEKTLTGWSADPRCLISRRVLSSRVYHWRRGVGQWADATPEALLTTPRIEKVRKPSKPAPSKLIFAWGELRTVRGWMRDARTSRTISEKTVLQRLRQGWPAESALSLPRHARLHAKPLELEEAA